MNLHEYQGKQLFAQYGLPVSQGIAVDSAEEAMAALDKIPGNRWVVKAQVHAGGRGKAGGVELISSKQEAADFANKWLGNRMVTYQTDADGQPVSKI
ncbi:MAG: ATP-grasp domain-containing protein, partial [Pseudomonadales bacterium]